VEASTWANIIAGAAVAVSVGIWVTSGRTSAAAKRAADGAETKAERAAAAQEAMANELAALRQHLAKQAPRREVRWRIVAHTKTSARLVQVGNIDARHVTITADTVMDKGRLDDKELMRPGDEETFMFIRAFGTSSDVTVTWVNPDGSNGLEVLSLP
jgi:P pilus assembly chaperone PapD